MTQTQSLSSSQHEEFTFSGNGEVYSFTVLQEPPDGYEWQAPYVLAMVRLDEGPLIMAQITDLDYQELPQIGDRVEMVTRKLTAEGETGIIVYGYKFRKQLAT